MKLRDKDFYINIFRDFLDKNNIKMFSRNTSLGAVFAEGFIRTKRNLPKRPVFEKGENNWVDILPAITKQNKNRLHSSTKLTPIQASLKKNEGCVYKNLLDKRNKNKQKFRVNNLVRTEYLKKDVLKRRYN